MKEWQTKLDLFSQRLLYIFYLIKLISKSIHFLFESLEIKKRTSKLSVILNQAINFMRIFVYSWQIKSQLA